jgi:hypothetical protein
MSVKDLLDAAHQRREPPAGGASGMVDTYFPDPTWTETPWTLHWLNRHLLQQVFPLGVWNQVQARELVDVVVDRYPDTGLARVAVLQTLSRFWFPMIVAGLNATTVFRIDVCLAETLLTSLAGDEVDAFAAKLGSQMEHRPPFTNRPLTPAPLPTAD